MLYEYYNDYVIINSYKFDIIIADALKNYIHII